MPLPVPGKVNSPGPEHGYRDVLSRRIKELETHNAEAACTRLSSSKTAGKTAEGMTSRKTARYVKLGSVTGFVVVPGEPRYRPPTP